MLQNSRTICFKKKPQDNIRDLKKKEEKINRKKKENTYARKTSTKCKKFHYFSHNNFFLTKLINLINFIHLNIFHIPNLFEKERKKKMKENIV